MDAIHATIVVLNYLVKFNLPYTLILCCAGKAKRYGSEKLLARINKKFLFEFSCNPFLKDIDCKNIVLVIPKRWHIGVILHLLKLPKFKYVYGGHTRTLSIINGLKGIETKYVFIHDGPRPFVNIKIIEQLKCAMHLNMLKKPKKLGIVPYEKNPNLLITENNQILSSNIKGVQTPQLYVTKEVQEVYSQLSSFNYRDTSSIYIEQKQEIVFIENIYINFKITYKHDLKKY